MRMVDEVVIGDGQEHGEQPTIMHAVRGEHQRVSKVGQIAFKRTYTHGRQIPNAEYKSTKAAAA